MSAKLTSEQWTAWGRFQATLADELEIEWTFRFDVFDFSDRYPTVEVDLRVPERHHFSIFDDIVTAAFKAAEVPGYSMTGMDRDSKIHNKIRGRSLVLTESLK